MSGKAVAERLQVKGQRRLAVLDAPSAVDRNLGVPDARAPADVAEIVLLFVRNRAELDRSLAPVVASLAPGAILWLAYPKLTSPHAGDLNRDIIAGLAPAYRLATVAQIAIDSDWSALRLKMEA